MRLRDWLAGEPYTLALSAGFFGFFAHAGVLLALEESGLLPAAVAGSSAGALVAGLWASGRSARSIADELLALRREDFWDVRPRLGLLAGDRFRARLDAALAVSDFAGCRVPAAISVFDVAAGRTRAVQRGDLAGAIHASCAFPLLFNPVWLDGRPHSDGGIGDRPGLAGVAPGARVLHHLLISRSPWRWAGSAALRPSARPALACLRVAGLPRVGPFRLAVGARALARAHAAAREALDAPASELVAA